MVHSGSGLAQGRSLWLMMALLWPKDAVGLSAPTEAAI